jgi:hypothetical protein
MCEQDDFINNMAFIHIIANQEPNLNDRLLNEFRQLQESIAYIAPQHFQKDPTNHGRGNPMSEFEKLKIALEIALAEYNNYVYDNELGYPILEVYEKHEAVILSICK